MKTRRQVLKYALASASLFATAQRGAVAAARTPLIVDTDIGDDIDDTWALMMLLNMPQFDVRLAVGDFANGIYRARLLAKLLEAAGRSDVPVGVGVDARDEPGNQGGWLGHYRLEDYPGTVHRDGVGALIDAIHASPEPVTLLCLGPVPNIAEALRRDPSIADNAHIVGMYGSVYRGYDGAPEPVAEWNVRVDPASLQRVFEAPWEITVTPLDTCGLVRLEGEDYRRIHSSDDPRLVALRENYEVWLPNAPYRDPLSIFGESSSTLFDTVAVYLAAERDLVEMRELPLRVTDEGLTVIDAAGGRPVDCAIAWKDLAAFERWLADVLLG